MTNGSPLTRLYAAVRDRLRPERTAFDFREADFPLVFDGFLEMDRSPDGKPFLWMGKRVEGRIRVSFSKILAEAAALIRPNRLTVRIDGEIVGTYPIGTEWTSVTVPTRRWKGRHVLLALEVDAIVIPREAGLWDDARELGLAIRKFESHPGPPPQRLVRDAGPKPPAPAARQRFVPRAPVPREGARRGAVVIATASISPDDAMSNDVLGMSEALAEAGYTPLLWTPAAADAEAALGRPEVPLIVHYGWKWPAGLDLLARAGSRRRLLRYHNITPSELFLRSNPQVLKEAFDAREGLPLAIARSTHFLAPSLTIAGDLLAAGAGVDQILYVPCFHRIETLLRAEPSPETSRMLKADPRRKLLVLGRAAPSKGIHHAIEVLARYREIFGDPPALHVVGPIEPRMEDYASELRSLAQRRGVAESVAFHGSASAPVVASFFRHCDVVVHMSESEAFPLPILEAQAFGRPIVGWNRGAKLEVAGIGQMLFATLDFDLYAEAIHALLTDAALYEATARRGRQNMESRFSIDLVRSRFLGVIDAMMRDSLEEPSEGADQAAPRSRSPETTGLASDPTAL